MIILMLIIVQVASASLGHGVNKMKIIPDKRVLSEKGLHAGLDTFHLRHAFRQTPPQDIDIARKVQVGKKTAKKRSEFLKLCLIPVSQDHVYPVDC
jgi:hypothetical protein